MTTDNKTIVRQALTTLLTTGDVDALAPSLTDDFLHHRPDSTSRSTICRPTATTSRCTPTAGFLAPARPSRPSTSGASTTA